MTRNEYEELQKTVAELEVVLASNDLEKHKREELTLLHARMCGALVSMWLPFSNIRRAIMFILFLIGLRAFMNHNNIFFLYWFIASLYSPRVMGALSFNFGRLMNKFN